MNARRRFLLRVLPVVFSAFAFPVIAQDNAADPGGLRFGGEIPPEVDAIYERGLAFLVQNQDKSGTWSSRGENGITGLCLMAFLASGEDPNFGRYRSQVRKAVRALIEGQDAKTGYFESSMYHHGFAMLALAEAYGAVDETALWDGTEKKKRTLAQALDLAVRCAVGSQKNNRWGGWRYSPESTDADTSVTGAVLMGLLACRNAGIEVPDEAIDNALEYMRRSTGTNGFVNYSGGFGGMGESMNRSAVATLVYAVGQKRDWDEYKATLGHISKQLEHSENGHRHYFLYYMAQALFQGDYDSWQKWNHMTARKLAETQADDGSFNGSYGQAYGTAMSLLAMALNYRFLPIYERF
ncbi:MAG: squalene--hopene cyclase [Verrucomicrobiales bacterium]|nr:squalene--hopene cyclase [Verrucomicrobiales bacterium]